MNLLALQSLMLSKDNPGQQVFRRTFLASYGSADIRRALETVANLFTIAAESKHFSPFGGDNRLLSSVELSPVAEDFDALGHSLVSRARCGVELDMEAYELALCEQAAGWAERAFQLAGEIRRAIAEAEAARGEEADDEAH